MNSKPELAVVAASPTAAQPAAGRKRNLQSRRARAAWLLVAPTLVLLAGVAGGFGSAVSEALDALGVAARVHRLGIPDRFVPHATQAEQREEIGIDEEGLLRAFRTGTAGAGVVPIRARAAG